MDHSKPSTCLLGLQSSRSKAMVLFKPLLLSESSVWPAFTGCLYFLAWDVRKDALGLVLGMPAQKGKPQAAA